MDENADEINRVTQEITSITNNINELLALLKKNINDWSNDDLDVYGDKEGVRKKIQLRDEEKNKLRDEKNKLRDEKNKLRDEKNKLLDITKDFHAAKKPRLANEEENDPVVEKFRSCPAPSTFGRPEIWKNEVEKMDNFICHRPGDRSGIHVSLYHPVFAEFLDDVETIPISFEDFQFASEFSTKMTSFYGTEIDRNEVFNHSLGTYFDQVVSQMPVTIANNRTLDAAIREMKSFIFLAELKNELGSSSACPYLQLCSYYSQCLPVLKSVLQETRAPAFGIYTSGPFLGIVGLIYVDGKVLCDPLTEFMPCFSINDGHTFMESLARRIKSLKVGIKKLKKLGEKGQLGAYDPFPYPREFSNGMQVKYVKILTDSTNRLVYLVQDVVDGALMVLKIVKKQCYGFGAHDQSAAMGFSPKIIARGDLAGKWMYVLMEYCSSEMGYQVAHEINEDQRKDVAQLMINYVTELHHAGFVHGDFRPNNVLVKFENGIPVQIMVVDFDFSGKRGEAKYPSYLNTIQIPWATGVASMSFLEPDHDLHFIDLFKSGAI